MTDAGQELFRIGELAKRSGCSRRQIQDFLVMGLIKSQGATSGGQHLFGAETVHRLRLVRKVLASGRKEYTMAELIRTFRRFLKILLLVVSLACCLAAGVALAGSEPPPAGGAALKEADRAGIRRLSDGLCEVMLKGDADQVRGLLSAGMPQARMETIVEKLRAEFNSYGYNLFTCEYLPAEDIAVLGPGRVRLSTIIRWEYADKSEPEAVQVDSVGQAFEFELVRENDVWRIADDRGFFDRLSSSQSTIFTRIFLWTAIGLVVFSFWGWMLLDACFRNWGGRRAPWVAAMILALLAGAAAVVAWQLSSRNWALAIAPAPAAVALVYFFAVWMRQGQED